MEDLAWLGLDHDGDPLTQTSRLEAHLAALESLQSNELAYPCTCSRADIARSASAPHAPDSLVSYPGTCSDRTHTDAKRLDKPFCWRFRMPSVMPEHQELVRRPASAISHPGDPIIWRADRPGQPGGPAYHLAVVVDDAFQLVGEIVRGADLLAATPIHRALQHALGLPAPRYAHVPLMTDHLGRRLAKRDEAVRLSTLRASGMRSEILIGQLAASAGLVAQAEPIRPADLVGTLDWAML
jgi:glutamyl/glutaminyl-tRNA synthetase